MSPDAIGIAVTILGSVLIAGIILAVATYFGLRQGFNPIGDKLVTLKEDIVTELSNIKEKVIKIEEVADNIWEYIGSLLAKEGTVILNLENFGKLELLQNLGYKKLHILLE